MDAEAEEVDVEVDRLMEAPKSLRSTDDGAAFVGAERAETEATTPMEKTARKKRDFIVYCERVSEGGRTEMETEWAEQRQWDVGLRDGKRER